MISNEDFEHLVGERLLNAKQVMEILNISRALFYTKIVTDEDFQITVKPVCLVRNGMKQYKYSELIKFIDIRQQKTSEER